MHPQVALLADAGPAAATSALAALRAAGTAVQLVLSPVPMVLGDVDVCVADGDLGQRVVDALGVRGGGWTLVVPGEADVDLPSAALAAPVLTAARSTTALRALVRATTAPLRRLTTGSRPLLSASLIVKDEQTALPTCLASLDGLVDEVVVCDTGSSDRTVEIAEAFGATVVRTTWDDDFAKARNVPLAACQGAWVLSIDADERVLVARPGDLRRSLTPRGVPAYGVLIRSATDDAAGGAGFEHEAIRLFRRAGLVWVGAVHETVADAVTGTPPQAVRLPAVSIDHDGYLGTVYRERDKAARNLELAEKDHQAALAGALGRSVAKTAYELARALSLQPGTEVRQEELLRTAIAQMPAGMGRLSSSTSLRLAALLRRTDRAAEAVGHAREALRLSPSDPTAAWELAEALCATDAHDDALQVLDTWQRQPLRDDEAVSRTAAVADVAIPATRARALVALGRPAEAVQVLTATARANPAGFGSWPLLCRLLQQTTETWAADLAALCPPDAFALLAAVDGLPAPEHRQLLAALRARGIEPAEHAAGEGFRSALADVLVDADPAAVAQAALALEQSQPHLALQAWLQLPPSASRQVALARCHLALDDLDGAFAALDDLDLAALDPPDLVTVALLAAHAGDAGTALAVLDALPEDVGELEDQVQALRAALPGRVHVGPQD